jgi:hypothetical protein
LDLDSPKIPHTAQSIIGGLPCKKAKLPLFDICDINKQKRLTQYILTANASNQRRETVAGEGIVTVLPWSVLKNVLLTLVR